jgi:hypothetical protein
MIHPFITWTTHEDLVYFLIYMHMWIESVNILCNTKKFVFDNFQMNYPTDDGEGTIVIRNGLTMILYNGFNHLTTKSP